MNVYADLRWNWQNGALGIGNVKHELLSRKPDHVNVTGLAIRGRLGSPTAPIAIARSLARSGARDGVFWSPGFMPPMASRIPVVVTVHDLIHLEYYSPIHKAYYDILLRPLYRRCRAIICVSEFTRQQFLAWSDVPRDRVVVVQNGVSEQFFTPVDGKQLGFPYILYPGNRRRYKNLERLLTAYSQSALPSRGIRFALTGEPDSELSKLAERLNIRDHVQFLGRIEQADLPRFYRGACLVVFVSLAEGFGLPIVEAMAAGVPAVTSNISAMPEVAGDAAILVDPRSVDAIRQGLEQAAFDAPLREAKIRMGLQRARQFNWNTSAMRFWELLKSFEHRQLS